MVNNDKANIQDDNDSGFNSDEEGVISFKKKRTKAQERYRAANAAIIPDFIPPENRKSTDFKLKETLVWTPNNKLSENGVMWFTSLAEKYGFSAEQSLALLHINKYNMEAAKRDLNLFMPFPSQWTQDKAVFINAVREEEKFFYAIKDKFFPNRSVGDMVEYYYKWKMENKKRKLKKQMRKEGEQEMNMPVKQICDPIITDVCKKT